MHTSLYSWILCEAACAHTCTQKLVWVAIAGWQLSWAEVKAWGPVTERTEGSSIIIKNDTSAPYCSLTASSSQAVRLFVRLLCQCGWSVFLNQGTFQSEKRKKRKEARYLMGRRQAEDKKSCPNMKVRSPHIFHFLDSVFRSLILIIWVTSSFIFMSEKFIQTSFLLCHLTRTGVIQTCISPSNSAVVCSCRNWHTWCQCGS